MVFGVEPNPHLCDVCQELFQGVRVEMSFGGAPKEPLPQTFLRLQKSAGKGCHLCRLRWRQIAPEERVKLAGCEKITFGFWKQVTRDAVVLEELWFEYFDLKDGEKGPSIFKSVLMKPESGMT